MPEAALITVLFVICLAGAYCNKASWFDVMVTIVVGIGAYLLSNLNVPMIPFILGFILGTTIETNFRKAMIMSDGDVTIFITRPICIILIVLTIVMLVGTTWMSPLRSSPSVRLYHTTRISTVKPRVLKLTKSFMFIHKISYF